MRKKKICLNINLRKEEIFFSKFFIFNILFSFGTAPKKKKYIYIIFMKFIFVNK